MVFGRQVSSAAKCTREKKMKSGICPKCKSTNVYNGSEVPFKRGAYAQYAIKVSAAFAAALDYYVCTDCGYVEGYVCRRSKLEKISKEWPKVQTE